MIPAVREQFVSSMRRFNRFYTRQIGLLNEGLLNSPLSLTEVRTLYELAHREQSTAVELRQELGLDAGYLSRILRKFEKRRWIKKKASDQDARQSFLSLTKEGRKIFKPLEARSTEQVGAILGKLPPAEQNDLVRAMQTIESILEPGRAETQRGEGKPGYVLRRPKPGDLLTGTGQKLGRNESSRLGGVHGDVALGVPAPLVALAGVTDRVVGVAQVDRPGPEHNALGRQRSAGAVSDIAEGNNRDDVVRQVWRHRTAPVDAADGNAGHDVHHARALRVAAQHDLGVRAGGNRGFDVIDHVFGAVTVMQLELAGGVVHRVCPDVHAAGLLAQRVDEGVADAAHAGWLVGAAREDDLGVGAVGVRDRRRARGDE